MTTVNKRLGISLCSWSGRGCCVSAGRSLGWNSVA